MLITMLKQRRGSYPLPRPSHVTALYLKGCKCNVYRAAEKKALTMADVLAPVPACFPVQPFRQRIGKLTPLRACFPALHK